MVAFRRVSPAVASSILLVEDEPSLQRIIGSVLGDGGHAVEAVSDAETALARLRRQPPVRLVVTDKNLPGHDGLWLLAAIRAGERDGTIVGPVGVVVTTGYPSRDSALLALAHDADTYLVKPFTSLARAAEQILGVIDDDLPVRAASRPRARRVADALAGLPVPLDDVLVAVLGGDQTTALERTLRGAGARLLPAVSAERAQVVVCAGLEEVRGIADRRRGPAFVLLHSGPSFKELVELIRCGGGAVVDPAVLAGGE